jgi:autotransporter-associated beta strand protein
MTPTSIPPLKDLARAVPAWAALIAFTFLAAASASAAEPVNFTWTAAESGDWSDGTKWTHNESSGTAPTANGLAEYVLEFNADGTYSANQDLSTGFLLNQLRFGGSAVTLSGNGIQFTTNGAALPAIEQNGAAEVTVATPVGLLADLTFAGTGAGTLTISGAVSGTGGLTMSGSGILSLTGANTYRGNTTVTSGTLRLAQANTGNDKSVVSITEGAMLALDFSGTDTVAALVIGGTAKPDGLYDASNSGGAITGTGGILVVTPIPSSNASLAALSLGSATLSPAFSPLTGNYSTSVSNAVSTINVTPTAAGEGATVTVNGTAVASGTASAPIALSVGPNLITTLVRAQDGVTTRTYTVNVNRASAATVATSSAVVIDASRATLNGSANPNGVSTVYFEYGTTPAFGSRTPDRDISGTTPRAFAASLTGLRGATTYHYRAVLFNAAGTIYGETRQFTTVPNPPVAATGAPSNATSSSATLIGAVNPNGVQASVYFEYGLTTAYGQSTPVQKIPAGFTTISVQAPNLPLIPNAAYHYRLVASNSAGTALGNDVLFTVVEGGGSGSGAPTAAPEVVTEAAAGIGTESAILQGTVNPNGGTTLVKFEYGLTPALGTATVVQGVGNGSSPVPVAIPVQGLLPGTTYYFRLTGSNSLGETSGEPASFLTGSPAPTAVTGESTVLTTTSVSIAGSVRARGATADVWIDYGTDGIIFNSVRATPESVSGDQNTEVVAELVDLAQGVKYFYRVRAIGPDGEGKGETRTFEVESLSGLIQQYPPGVPTSARQGSVIVTLDPVDGGTGWRFAGEQFWRDSGVPATGLTTGDRVIEYRPVPGYVQPPNEAVSVISSAVPTSFTRTYAPTSEPGNSSLVVTLKPQDLTENIAPARWRFFGEGDDQWKESGTQVDGLVAGNYVIESKPVDGRSTPAPVTATLQAGQTTGITITYYIADQPVGTPPSMVPFEAVSSDTSLPNAFVGQIRGDAGSGTGFVVRPRVVATVGHVVFDDGTLALTTGLQWLFQRDRGMHDPVPQIPRGNYLMTGYAAQRILDNSPGVSSPQSQNLDAATLFFLQDVGRGGFSGYVASDTSSNEFLLSSSLKTLVGYPIDGIPEADLDRMHATPPANIAFTQAFGRTFTTPDIRSSGGASGAPLCVLSENGAYYPAAIYLGGTGQTVVRAIDSELVELISFADASSVDGVGVNGGSQLLAVEEAYENPDLGALKVVIEPAAARNAGAGWRLSSQSPYLPSGSQLSDLSPGEVTISFPALEGFVPPTPQSVTVAAGVLKTITFVYEQVVTPPLITSGGTASGSRGETLSYQITADHSPALFSLTGVLPAGLTFSPATGQISGILNEAGVFTVDIGASNTGGADSRKLVITSLPVLASQTGSEPYQVPASIALVSSESGGGVTWTATGLPGGLTLNPSNGVISGIPQVPGVYEIPISVTKLGATSAATLTLTITGIPPVFTLQPAAARTIQYGATTTLTVAATGLPEPEFQWYEGPSGNTDIIVPGATSTVFTTPVLTYGTSYWVRASSISGTADSSATVISISPSSNANLVGLVTSDGAVSPAFNSNATAYFLTVPNEVSAIQLTPLVEVSQSTVRVNGVLVPQDGASEPVALIVGSNLINIDVTAGNGTTTKRYTLTVTRALPPSIATVAATDVTDSSVILRGTASPNGAGTVFFQYGPSAGTYGSATPGQEISGTTAFAIAAPLAGLESEVTYHYRIGITTGAGTIFGDDMSFTTTKAPPLVATGRPSDVETGKVKLIGAVDPNGTPTTVYFEYGLASADPPYGLTTPPQLVPGGTDVIDIEFTVEGLIDGEAYRYRLVGSSTEGMAYGEDVTFTAGQANSGSGTPVAKPDATTLDPLAVTSASAIFQGSANPQGGTTFVRFDYGPTANYGQSTTGRGIGNGTEPITVSEPVSGLIAGITYHYRVVATNSLGTTFGEDRTFSTGFLAPQATTGGSSPLTVSSVQVNGSVRARGATVDVFFDYGTDGVNFPNRVAAAGGTVSGDAEVPVRADLTGLQGGVTYYYRVTAIRTDDPTSSGTGEVKTFSSDALIGLFQKFPRELGIEEYQGEVQVNLLPLGTGKWRFVGEVEWRTSGTVATGMATGDREIEFLPVAGLLQPARELVGVISGAPRLVLDREYSQSATPGDSGLQVFLYPASRVTATPTSNRVQWRLVGEPTWKNSGEQITGLMPGSYLVEFKKAHDLDAPAPATVVVAGGEIRTASFAYNPELEVDSSSMRTLDFSSLSTNRNLPHAYVGQIRTDAGSHSGFVVKPRVVATTAQAVFDEVTLSQIPGMQWLFQRDREVHEPKPMVPRGFYVFDGYAAQRETENTPGKLSTTAQGLNAAAIYFPGDAGRGGYSGFLSTSPDNSPLLNSSALKILTGYPVRGGLSTSNFGRMQATRATSGTFTPVSSSVFSSSRVRGLSGMPGGPLCIQRDGGSYYPVGIHLGGTEEKNLYRVIDSTVIDLFNRAELTANTGDNNNTGGISQTSYTAVSTTSTKGALTVILEPAEARAAGALWKLGTDASYVLSGTRKNNLTPGNYVLQIKPLPGFQTPAQQTVSVFANNLTTVTFTYVPEISAVASWRQENFGTTTNAGTASDSEDPDGDGSLNIDEYIAGTNPQDAADVFKVASAGLNGTTFTATVPGKTGRTYILQRQDVLGSGLWINVETKSALPADGPLTLTDFNATSSKGFYRVLVER